MSRNLIILAMIVFIDTAGIGLIVPVMPSLIQSLTGEGIDRAAELGGWLPRCNLCFRQSSAV